MRSSNLPFEAPHPSEADTPHHHLNGPHTTAIPTPHRADCHHLSYFPSVWLDDAAAGFTAGVVSTIVFHPLELVKTRLQVQTALPQRTASNAFSVLPTPGAGSVAPTYRNSLQCARHMIKYEGPASLYRGLTPNMIGNVSAWGLYFMLYNRAKELLYNLKQDHSTLHAAELPLTTTDHLAAAALTGASIQLLTNPIWVTKTRMFLDYRPQFQATANTLNGAAIARATTLQHYPHFWSSLTRIYRHEGIGGLYKGFTAGLLGVSHGAVQFAAYEQCKKVALARRKRQQGIDFAGQRTNNDRMAASSSELPPAHDHWSSSETMVMAAVSKSIAAVITYPYQVIRSRLQSQGSQYTGLVDCVTTTLRVEGIRGLYRGLGINIVKVTPQAVAVFLVYEKMQQWLKTMAQQRQIT